MATVQRAKGAVQLTGASATAARAKGAVQVIVVAAPPDTIPNDQYYKTLLSNGDL